MTNLQKIIVKVLAVLLVGLFIGWVRSFKSQEKRNEHAKNTQYFTPNSGGTIVGKTEYEVIVIDSCEYIYAWFGAGNGGGSLTHKGNCKFCKMRK